MVEVRSRHTIPATQKPEVNWWGLYIAVCNRGETYEMPVASSKVHVAKLLHVILALNQTPLHSGLQNHLIEGQLLRLTQRRGLLHCDMPYQS